MSILGGFPIWKLCHYVILLRKKQINHHCLAGSVGRACYALLSNHKSEGPLHRHPRASKSPKLTSCTWKISWVTGHTWSFSVLPTSIVGNNNLRPLGPAKWLLFTNALPISSDFYISRCRSAVFKIFHIYKCKPVRHSTQKNNIRYFDSSTMQYRMTWYNVRWKTAYKHDEVNNCGE